ncbi:hypothetical protein ACF0H5_015426 [Mactra antiquata]
MAISVYKIIIVVFGLLSIIFQAIGFLAPAWELYDLDVDLSGTHTTFKVSVGFYLDSVCINDGATEVCRGYAVSLVYPTILKVDQKDVETFVGEILIREFLILQIFVILSGIIGGFGFILMIVQLRTDERDTTNNVCAGRISSCAWIVAGIILIAVVGVHGNEYSVYKAKMDSLNSIPEIIGIFHGTINFPWAIAMEGAGSWFALIVGAVVAVKYCYKQRRQEVGTWVTFTNPATDMQEH